MDDRVVDMSEVKPMPRVTFADMLRKAFTEEQLEELLAWHEGGPRPEWCSEERLEADLAAVEEQIAAVFASLGAVDRVVDRFRELGIEPPAAFLRYESLDYSRRVVDAK